MSANFRRYGRSPPTTVRVRKLGDCRFVWYKNIRSTFFGYVTKNACDRRTIRQTYNSQDRTNIAARAAKIIIIKFQKQLNYRATVDSQYLWSGDELCASKVLRILEHQKEVEVSN